jgi:hypothetical protein
MEVGDEAEEGAAGTAEFGFHRVDAAHSADRLHAEHDDHCHFDGELEEVGDEHAPETGESGDK